MCSFSVLKASRYLKVESSVNVIVNLRVTDRATVLKAEVLAPGAAHNEHLSEVE